MTRTINQIKGDELEDAVRLIESAILKVNPFAGDSPITIEPKKIVVVEGVKHEIDIYITINNGKGYTSTFIFECKNWKAKISKNEIIAFAQKVKDVKAQKGYFVARRFTSDAIAQAKRDVIELLTAQNAIDTLPAFLENFHVLVNKVITPESSARFTVKLYDPQMVGFNPEFDSESFAKYKDEEMLLSKVIERLQQQILDKRMRRERTETFDEEIRRYKTTEIVNFSDGELFVEGLECQTVELRVVWESQVIRPAITSHFDIKTRGKVITVETDKLPNTSRFDIKTRRQIIALKTDKPSFEGGIKISFVDVDEITYKKGTI